MICTLRILLMTAAIGSATGASEPRQTISLDGSWQIAEGTMAAVPQKFERVVPVPGLVDLAQPPFEKPGPERTLPRGKHVREADRLREAFWYRRSFDLPQTLPAVVQLKVNKARYGTAVWLNGRRIGEHLPCFTPGWFDLATAARPGRNEILIRIGSSPAVLPASVVDGHDHEKIRYIPGIFDSVEVILTGSPHLVNVQVAPDVENGSARVRTEVSAAGKAVQTALHFAVREWKSGRVVARHEVPVVSMEAHSTQTVDVVISLPHARLWSPEDPFLYVLEATTGADTLTTRFGMRSFVLKPGAEPGGGRAYLNGKMYYLRGNNITMYRFFEDPQRGALPWNEDWVRTLHRRCKEMHWNALRYCIGFPPERWYDIADEEGILIQDEFPIWYGASTFSSELTPPRLAGEYTEWMRQRWNHPCVAIWDAQNESLHAPETSQAIGLVRTLDLSNRPWDNGWMPPQAPGDCYEAHPYLFNRSGFDISQISGVSPIPHGPQPNVHNNAIIINEYGWLWLNRDGTPTTLTVPQYQALLGPQSTAEQRREIYARMVALLTEFWRCHRKCAGVLHFCALGYSRPVGQTSDNWIDVKNLIFEPHFAQYVADAFAPVGLMIDHWAKEVVAGQPRQAPVVVINDLYDPWKGQVRMRLSRQGKVLWEETKPATVEPLGQITLPFAFTAPAEPGDYQLEAALLGPSDAKPVRSRHDFSIISEAARRARLGIAVDKPVKASSNLVRSGATSPEAAVDGRLDTRWSSEFGRDPQWLAVDLGAVTAISRVELVWQGAYATSYAIEVSLDGEHWKEVYATTKGAGGTEVARFQPVQARWVRMLGKQRVTRYGYSLWEMRVFP